MKMNEIILFTILFVTVLFVLFAVFRPARAPAPEGPRACTEEAKLCPDGSSVGRTGPNCEFAACPGVADTGMPPPASGVTGTVVLGPTCPVLSDPPDSACADKPFATAVLVYRTGANTPYRIGNSDANGTFRLSLPPGSYTVTATGGEVLPRCGEVSVAVVPGEYVPAVITCDTGIR